MVERTLVVLWHPATDTEDSPTSAGEHHYSLLATLLATLHLLC